MTHPQNSPHGATDTAPAQGRQTAIETVYEQLREGVISGAFEPGSRLNVDKLRQEYEVSTSTMREALSRLLVDNLVTAEGQRGFRVAPISLEDFREISELRILLETQAVRDSIANADDAWENRLVASHHQLAKQESRLPEHRQDERYLSDWEARNAEFHDAMVSACTNMWLRRFRAMVFAHSVRYRRIVVREEIIPRDVRAEHQALFDAAIGRDVETTLRLTADHIRNSVVVMEARLAELARAG